MVVVAVVLVTAVAVDVRGRRAAPRPTIVRSMRLVRRFEEPSRMRWETDRALMMINELRGLVVGFVEELWVGFVGGCG